MLMSGVTSALAIRDQPDPSLKADVPDRGNGHQAGHAHRYIAHRVIVPEQGVRRLLEHANRVSGASELCGDYRCQLDDIIRCDKDRINTRENQGRMRPELLVGHSEMVSARISSTNGTTMQRDVP